MLPMQGQLKPSGGGGTKCCALYDFKAEQDGDLDFVKGDLIMCTKTEGEWWSGRSVRTGKTGTFPSNYVDRQQ